MAAHEGCVLVPERNVERGARARCASSTTGSAPRPCSSTLRTGAPIFGCRIAAACSSSPFSPTAARLAVAVRLGAVDAERGHRPLRQQLAELLADRDQRREVLDIAAGKRDSRSRRSPRPAASAATTGLAHLQMGLLDHGDDLANDGAHRVPASLPVMHATAFYRRFL